MHFFFHVPKTAGTSFRRVLKNIFRSVNDEELDQASATALQSRLAEERDIRLQRLGGRFRERAEAYLRRRKLIGPKRKRTVVVGHFGGRLIDGDGALLDRYPWIVGNPEIEVVTILRDPLEHAISTYYHRVRQGKSETMRMTLGEFLQTRHPFAYRRVFGDQHEPATLLANFGFAGVAEELQRSTDLFTDRIGVARRTAPVENIGPRDAQSLSIGVRERSRFEEFYDWEYALYHTVRDQVLNPSTSRRSAVARFRHVATPREPVIARYREKVAGGG